MIHPICLTTITPYCLMKRCNSICDGLFWKSMPRLQSLSLQSVNISKTNHCCQPPADTFAILIVPCSIVNTYCFPQVINSCKHSFSCQGKVRFILAGESIILPLQKNINQGDYYSLHETLTTRSFTFLR